MAVKKAPATGLLNCLVTKTVTPKVVAAETPAPIRLRVPPRATSASCGCPPPPLPAGRPAGTGPAGAGLPFGVLTGALGDLPRCAEVRGAPA